MSEKPTIARRADCAIGAAIAAVITGFLVYHVSVSIGVDNPWKGMAITYGMISVFLVWENPR